jgi:hypothetical protein
MIVSPWFPIASFLAELLTHASKAIITKVVDVRSNRHLLEPKPLLQLRMHLAELRDVTDKLATETEKVPLSQCYAQLRAQWLELFAPAQTVLHNFDPMTLTALNVYSPDLASLLNRGIFVSEKALSAALIAEQTEIKYDGEAHLCTLCLQVVKDWSSSTTMAGGLNHLTITLDDTLKSLVGCP